MRTSRSPAELGLSHRDRVRLSKHLKQCSDARLYRRLQAVLLVAQGLSIATVATLSETDQATIYRWVGRYLQDHQPTALTDLARSGRPKAASNLTQARLERELKKDPLLLGYNASTWTVPLLGRHLSRQCNCSISERTLRRRLHQAGYRWKRPRYVYVEKEPHRAQKKGLSSGV